MKASEAYQDRLTIFKPQKPTRTPDKGRKFKAKCITILLLHKAGYSYKDLSKLIRHKPPYLRELACKGREALLQVQGREAKKQVRAYLGCHY